MTIKLTRESEEQAIASIQRYFSEGMDDETGNLKAKLLLDFVLAEIAPTVYNQAISDAEAYFHGKVADLEGACYEQEFGYWPEKR